MSAFAVVALSTHASVIKQSKGEFEDKFRQLDESLPTANVYRNAAGEPGHEYWQQQVDYQINARLNEQKRRIDATQTVTYFNNSPDTLKYLWLQLDQNYYQSDSIASRSKTFSSPKELANSVNGKPTKISLNTLRKQQFLADNDVGYEIGNINTDGKKLSYTIVGTNMRIDLLTPLKPGNKIRFSFDYGYNITDQKAVGGRSGYEHFVDDKRQGGNDIFQLAQWFPRLHAYTDYEAWTNKAFLGSGEFTLEFGDYDVELTVPADHIVASTGYLANSKSVLTSIQRQRFEQAKTSKRPVFIVTEEEALANEAEGTADVKTWHFKAKNVRDFAWASSRKFMWDAKGYQQPGSEQELVMAMSFYPKEGGDLWKKYSTETVIHTMQVYSRYSFDYPYPTAQSINGPVGGMEYPMITFNGPRTELQEDGTRTYSLSEKRFLIGVVIHEIGHIYFPMIVNSDERQWTWMDEGLNSFVESIAVREWETDPHWAREPRDIIEYMKSSVQVPIMTQSDSILKFGPNAYTKPAIALNILREVILGRELFDFAFKEYATRWKYKRPTPSDFFRTMEEASGVDLDWFWRGWFYSTDHVDLGIDKIYKLNMTSNNPDIDFNRERDIEQEKPTPMAIVKNQQEGIKTWVELNDDITDFYDKNDQFTVTNKERNKYNKFLKNLKPWEREVIERAVKEDQNYYVLEFSNVGGLVMPILLQLTYTDGSIEELHIPAEIWRRSPKLVNKLIVTDKELKEVEIDPSWQTADVELNNNYFPRRIIPSRIEAFKKEKSKRKLKKDIMQDIKTEINVDNEDDAKGS
ncbi:MULTISPECIES: M1 family metallopeptidase [unclassified Shewanella]|uniref:M1 family metallopeptidase n=1 Tax=unclassified Shewanella TaxID=196818 RepID=UPI001BC7B0BD|nr:MULTISPECIES: M1 family metallopeptidase [unclassified Shewanella]GIU10614.1 aminopeptidase [Shewanella sp. MBTL60-112-B1]GIU40289.1 aminopeptidase [Shewanella sp. MBTL60-112-B2]